MNAGRKIQRIFVWLGVILLQLVMTQVVTFLFALFVPGMEKFQQTHSALFILIVGVTFSAGVFLGGWLALKRQWLKGKPYYAARLAATLIGAYLPLIIALILYRILEAGNPFFLVSILTSILGFHIPGWIGRE